MMSDDEGPWGGQTPASPPPPSNHRQRRGLVILGVAIFGAIGLALLVKLFPGQITGADWSYPIYGIGFLALVSTSLFSRRLKLGEVARYAAIWAGVAAVLFVGYVFRDDFLGIALRVRSELVPAYAVPAGPRTLAVTQSAGGGYFVMGQVNGQPVKFLIDTGSSDIVLSPADAQRLGVNLSALSFDQVSETANGPGLAAAYTVGDLAVGPIRLTQVPVSVNKAEMSDSLLGMAFLKRLDSFEFKDRRLILRGRP
jgi:aspartyl protease family protein